MTNNKLVAWKQTYRRETPTRHSYTPYGRGLTRLAEEYTENTLVMFKSRSKERTRTVKICLL